MSIDTVETIIADAGSATSAMIRTASESGARASDRDARHRSGISRRRGVIRPASPHPGVASVMVDGSAKDGLTRRAVSAVRWRRWNALDGFHSLKLSRTVTWETPLARDLCIIADADARVVSYAVQPHTLELVSNHECLAYVPDAAHVLADGTTAILCIEQEGKAYDSDHARTIDLAERTYRALGWEMHRVKSEDIYRGPRYQQSLEVCLDCDASVTSAQVAAAVGAVRAGRSEVGAVSEVLGGGDVGRARLHALMRRRVLDVDLETLITAASNVRVVESVLGGQQGCRGS